MAVKPITPREVASLKQVLIPDAVIEAFNEMIAANFNGGYSSFTQEAVVKLIVKKGISRNDLFSNNWLDVEPIYEKSGWKVEYDKPGYNESYEPTFSFKKK